MLIFFFFCFLSFCFSESWDQIITRVKSTVWHLQNWPIKLINPTECLSSNAAASYRSTEKLQSKEGHCDIRGRWRVQGLRYHLEGRRDQEQENVEAKQRFQELEVGEDAGAKAPTHRLERHLPQLQGVHEGEPAVPTLSSSLTGARGREEWKKNKWFLTMRSGHLKAQKLFQHDLKHSHETPGDAVTCLLFGFQKARPRVTLWLLNRWATAWRHHLNITTLAHLLLVWTTAGLLILKNSQLLNWAVVDNYWEPIDDIIVFTWSI